MRYSKWPTELFESPLQFDCPARLVIWAIVFLATSTFLGFNFQNAVPSSYLYRCWSVSLFYSFLQTDVTTHHINSLCIVYEEKSI